MLVTLEKIYKASIKSVYNHGRNRTDDGIDSELQEIDFKYHLQQQKVLVGFLLT